MIRLSQFTRRSLVAIVVLAVVGIAALIYVPTWLAYRFTHSISRDAFVESHLVNLSPQVAGNVVTLFVQEQERVKKGQLLAVIDPSIYQREVDLSAAKLEVSKAALAKTESDLNLLQLQVPQQVAAAEAKLSAARDIQAKSNATVGMIQQNVDDAVTAAAQEIAATQASLVLADEDFSRYGALYSAGSVTQRKFQEATKARGVAEAERKIADAKLGQAQANRQQIDIAKQELAAAKSSVSEAEASLALAQLGAAQITVLQRQVAQRTQDVAEADRGLQLAQTRLGYTQITA
ncbi:MAG TPA: biotin/lipoyl-binding protein, partial [Pirellulales bacterium]